MKKHQKMIAAFVAIAFLSLLQISAMPQAAQQAPGQAGTSMSSPDEAPNFIEEEGTTGYQPKKKSMLPIILGVVALGAVVAVLVLVVLKTKYDITGSWNETNTIAPGTTTLTFSGDKKSGTLALLGYIDTGAYTVNGKTVHFEFHASGLNYNWVYDGEFDGKDLMKGTVKYYVGANVNAEGTWSASRIAAGAPAGRLPIAGRSVKELK